MESGERKMGERGEGAFGGGGKAFSLLFWDEPLPLSPPPPPLCERGSQKPTRWHSWGGGEAMLGLGQ